MSPSHRRWGNTTPTAATFGDAEYQDCGALLYFHNPQYIYHCWGSPATIYAGATISHFRQLALLTTISLSTSLKMPTESTFPKLDIPNLDLWGFLFERKDKPFPDDKGK